MILARSRAGVSPRRRVENIFGRLPEQIDVLEGDLTCPEGIKHAAERLQLIDTVIHCAAETSFDTEREALRLIHIEGPLALLDILGANGLRSWSQISTAFVCGRRTGTVYEHETDLGQEFHNSYERFEAGIGDSSQASLRATWDGVANLQTEHCHRGRSGDHGRSTVESAAHVRPAARLAWPYGRAKTCHVRICGLPHARFNIVPVEYVARAIAELAEEPQASGKTFHLVTDDPPTQAEILNMLSAFLSQGSASCRTGRTDLQSVIRRVEDCKAAASLQRLFGTGRSLRFFRRAPVAQQSRCADARDRSPRSGSSHPARVILQQAMACEFGLGRPQEKRLTDCP